MPKLNKVPVSGHLLMKEYQMKRTILFLAIALLAMLILGCAEKPSSVADKFLSAMQKNDVETMKSLSTEESVKAIEFIGMIQQESRIIKSYKILGTETTDEMAKVTYTVEMNEDYKSNDDENKEEVLTLVKRDGKWKVHIEKDGMQK